MLEDILANGLPIIAMWTAKYDEGGFYVLIGSYLQLTSLHAHTTRPTMDLFQSPSKSSIKL